jgi:hypothetical protein
MPENVKFRNIFIEKIEDIALVLLLPLFFVYTGLRTEIGLLNDPTLWKVTGIIILVAIAGKFAGSALAARFIGQTWKDSLIIGTLMNTRGLVELVVLNIGYDLGALTPEMFTMLVIMALFTTFLTGPALDLINWSFKTNADVIPKEVNIISKFKILVSFGKPESGQSLFRLASSLVKRQNSNETITAMHLMPSDIMHHYNLEEYENICFAHVIEESQKLNQKISTLFKVTNDLDSEISEFANKGAFDLLLIGIGQSIYEGSLLGKILGFSSRIINPDRLINQVKGRENIFEHSPFDERTRAIISKSNIPVGVLIDKGLSKTENICIPIITQNDAYLMDLAQKLINCSGSIVSVIDLSDQINNLPLLGESIRQIDKVTPRNITVMSEQGIEKEFLKQQDLMLISCESWDFLIKTKSNWLTEIPSTLIIAQKN